MSKKTKKRLVTTVACAIPAVIAVPSLLTLTQCGTGSSGTETKHISLSGKTKKEEAIPVFDDTVTYQFLLNDVKDPTTIQVSLPHLYINNTEIENTKKLTMYQSYCGANGLVTIVFDTNKLRNAATNELNDAKIQTNVRFDVELKNDQIDETVTGFNLNLTIPEYAVTLTGEHCTIQGDNVCYYNEDYVATIVPDAHYEVKGAEDITVTVNGEAYTTFGFQSNVITIHGEDIKGEITISVKANAKTYSVKHDSTWDTTISGLPTKATYGVDIDADISYGPAIEEETYKVLLNRKVYVTPEGTETPVDITDQCKFELLHLHIPGELITGTITLEGEMTPLNINVTTMVTTAEGFKTFNIQTWIPPVTPSNNSNEIISDTKPHNIFHEINGTYSLEDGYCLDEYHVYIGSGESRYELDKSEYTFKNGIINIPYKYVYDDILIEASAAKITYTTNTTGDDNLKFAQSEITTDWGKQVDAGFTLSKGFELSSATVTKIFPTGSTLPIKNYVTTYVTGHEGDKEYANGITIPSEYLRDTFKDSKFTIVATSKACERQVNVDKQHCSFDGASIATIDKEYSGTFTVDKNYELNSVTVTVGTRTLGASEYSYDKATGKFVIYKGVVDAGPVGITAHATAIVRTVTLKGTHCTVTGDPTATCEDDYTCTITADEYYDVQKPTVTIGGETYTGGTWTPPATLEKGTGTYTIPKADINGNIEITSVALATKRTVNVTANNCAYSGPTEATCESDYVGTFTANTGYALPEKDAITVTMGSGATPFTNFTWDKSTGKLTIDKQYITTTPIAIVVTATVIEWNVTCEKTNCEFVGDSKAYYTKSYLGKFTANTGYHFTSGTKPSVTMGGQSFTNFIWNVTSESTAELYIAEKVILGDIHIKMDATISERTVTKNGTKCTIEGDDKAYITSDYTCTITPDTGYRFDTTPTVTIDDDPYTGFSFSTETKKLTIPKDDILGNIVINCTCVPTERQVTITPTNCTYTDVTPSSPTIETGFECKFVANQGYEFTQYPVVTIGGQPTSNYNFNKETGEFSIDKQYILGDITITLTATTISRSVHTKTTKCTFQGPSEATIAEDYKCTFTPDTGYEFASGYKPQVKIGGQTIAQSLYYFELDTQGVGTLTIPKAYITDDIGIACTATVISRTVTKDPTNCTINGATEATIESDYTCTITPDANYELVNLPKLTIGTETFDAPKSWFVVGETKQSGVLTIPSKYILGNITIEYEASLISRTVTKTGVNCTITGEDEATYGNDYTCTITPDEHYSLSTAPTVTIGGTSYTNYSWSVDASTGIGTLKIDGDDITGNITISLTATHTAYTVDKTGATNCTITGNDNAYWDEEYSFTITPDAGYKLSNDIGCTIAGKTFTIPDGQIQKTASAWYVTLKAGQVTGKVVISYEATLVDYNVTTKLTHCTLKSGTGGTIAHYTTDYDATYIADEGYEFTASTTPIVLVGSSAISYTWDYTAGTLKIAAGRVTDDVTISLTATAIEYDVDGTGMTDCTFEGEDTATCESDYTCTVKPNTGFALTKDDITVEIGGNEVDFTYNTSTGALTIDKGVIDNDIVISATATAISYDVGVTGVNCTKTAGGTSGTYKDGYTCTITPATNYEFATDYKPTVTMGGLTFDDFDFTPSTGELTIGANKITGKIAISATATAIGYDVISALATGHEGEADLSGMTDVGYVDKTYTGTFTFDPENISIDEDCIECKDADENDVAFTLTVDLATGTATVQIAQGLIKSDISITITPKARD